MVVKHRWMSVLVLIAGLAMMGASTVRALDRCGSLGRAAWPSCASWEWEEVNNVTTGEKNYLLKVRNQCSETMTVKAELGGGTPDMRGDVAPYTGLWMWRYFKEDEKSLLQNVWCCKKMSRCDYN